MPQEHKFSVPVFALDGKKLREESLPAVFSGIIEPELIERAVLAINSASKQPQGVMPHAGMNTTAEYRASRKLPANVRGMNIERSRLPRTKNHRAKNAGRVAGVPRSVGGPKAHPPRVEKNIEEKINKKEKRAALNSAVAASREFSLVSKRHFFEKEIPLPVVIEDKFEELTKTKDVVKTLKAIGISSDLENAKKKTRMRSGKARRRGRTKKEKKSILIVTGKNAAIYKAARNLEGVDISPFDKLSAALLAPGGMPGRLTVFTESALAGMKKW
ncbi:MAG: 50S ribosomal protein L4 [Candidatus Diapherotrites archaeon]